MAKEGGSCMEDVSFDKVPAYIRVKREIIKKIKDENLAPHYKLPSEDELAAQYQVARGTIRQALSELSREHVIYRLHGKGTFVCAREREHVLDSLRFLSFWDEMVENSCEFQNKLLDVQKLLLLQLVWKRKLARLQHL